MESFGLRIYCDLLDGLNRRVSIPSILKNSELINILSENIDKNDNILNLDLKDKCDYETLMFIEKILSNFEKLQYIVDLQIADNNNQISDTMKYLMINEEKRLKIEEYIEMCKNFNWEDIMDTNNLEDYFFSKVLYPENRKKVSIYPFLNTFLKNYYECSIQKIWHFINIFNKYVSNMRNLNQNLPKEYHTINIFEFLSNYDNETGLLIKNFLIPQSIFNFHDNGYSVLNKISELLKIKSKFDEDEFIKFVQTHPDSENIYFAGSSILYCILKNYDINNVNDIDIWINVNNPSDYCNRFFRKTINDIDHKKYRGKLRNAILDIERETGVNIQFLHLQNKDGYDVIQTFDLPILTCYLQIRNQKEELIMTTHCMESLYFSKVMDLYNNEIDRSCTQIKKRIIKYTERGFVFAPYFYELIENFNNNIETIETDFFSLQTFNLKSLDIPYVILKKFSNHIFRLDYSKYVYSLKKMEEKDKKEITGRNTFIMNDIFGSKLFSKNNQDLNIMNNHYLNMGLAPYTDRKSRPYAYHNFNRLMLINSENGELINKYVKEYELFDIDLFSNLYDIESIYCENGKLFFNPNKN